MKHLFISYELALIAKEKGFDEPCFTKYEKYFDRITLYPILSTFALNGPYENEYYGYDQNIINDRSKIWRFVGYKNSVKDHNENILTSPTYQQIIDWFIVKHEIHPCYGSNHSGWYWNITKTNGTTIKEQTDCNYFEKHYEALNRSIEEAFKLI